MRATRTRAVSRPPPAAARRHFFPGAGHGRGRGGPFFQAKLEIGAPGDRYEREADAVADRVTANAAAAPVQAVHAVEGTASPRALVQRQPAPQQATPQAQTIPQADQGLWVGRVDAAVRTRFGLTAAGLNLTRVRFLDQAGFAAAFPAGSIEEKLLELFLDPPSSVIHSILRQHRIIFASLQRLQRFVRDRVAAGFFEEGSFNPATGQIDVTQITPRDLLAMHVGGVTDVGPAARGARRVLMQMPADVETLVHEACHFYVSNGFRRMAAAVPNRGNLQVGVGIEHTLMEGFAEYFARQVMRDNAATFGPLTVNAYQLQVDQVWRFAATLGQAATVAAYFHGNAAALGRMQAVLAMYETTPLGLVEPWEP